MTADISVLIPTYNRAYDLNKTLEGMVRAKKKKIAIEFIIIDNGSEDDTKLVVKSFQDRLKIQYLFEPRKGKNRALNCALKNTNLGEVLVFTDDDVDPSKNWFIEIMAACKRYPNHYVFGGKINVTFPDENLPNWSFDPLIRQIAFSYHCYSNRECIYETGVTPFGPNYWVKKIIFQNGHRFNERIGPQPKNRIMGSETSFLLNLQNDGLKIVYIPKSVVSHRIQKETLKFFKVCSRGYRLGRGEAHFRGLPQVSLLQHSMIAWLLYRVGSIIWNSFKLLMVVLFSSQHQRPNRVVTKFRIIGYQIEAMRTIYNHRQVA